MFVFLLEKTSLQNRYSVRKKKHPVKRKGFFYRAGYFSERIDKFVYLKQASLQAQVFLQASLKLNVRNLVFAVVSFVSLLLFKKK